MASSGSAQVQPVSPRSAPLKAASTDLTLEEIEESISNLALQPSELCSSSGTASIIKQERDSDKSRFREVHHVDAEATSSAQPAASASQRPEQPEGKAPSPVAALARAAGANGHIAPLSGHKNSSLPHSLDVSSAGTQPPSRSQSPGLTHSSAGSRRAASHGQLWSSAEIEVSSPEGGSLNDSFTQQLMAGAMKLKSSLFKPERISFSDVARNPALAKRARAEMDSHQMKGMIEGSNGEVIEGRPHELEVTRLQVALDVVETDAEEESKINSQLAQLVCLRLEASRRAVERMLGLLQAVTAAESAYTRAMNAASKVKIASECDGPTLRTALNRFLDIPWLVAESHASSQNELVETTRRCQELVQELRRECQSISHDASRAHSAVLHARKALSSAFLGYQAACRSADDAALESFRSGRRSTSVRLELDPWLTESRVVSAHRSLHASQTHQRAVLAAAYGKVKKNELHRCEVFRDATNAFLVSFRNDLARDVGEDASIRAIVDAVDCEKDLAQFTASAAAAVDTGEELAARQSAALESSTQDLLCSPDIIRQGEMAKWVSGAGKWSDCHFILTRSGFLHWLASAQDLTPRGSLNLSKCQFEAGDAPQFNINEHQGGLFGKSKRICLKAPTIEDCCEWAIALREMIAAHKVR